MAIIQETVIDERITKGAAGRHQAGAFLPEKIRREYLLGFKRRMKVRNGWTGQWSFRVLRRAHCITAKTNMI